MSTALVGLGANIGEPEQQLREACAALNELTSTSIARSSQVYQSAPMGPQDQPPFLNACVQLETDLTPTALLDALHGIEQRQGRQRGRRWGERCIDLDLLFYDDVVSTSEALQLPHPGVRLRDFVLQPLIDILGRHWRLPDGTPLADALAAVDSHNLKPTDIRLMHHAELST
jgi:2-amino-4-hydroxy-6-hydroxymethyldihydropteridine diphosphokinase